MEQTDANQFFRRLEQADRLNAGRLERARSLMNPYVRQVLKYVPVLLHYNSPKLPGYREGPIPYGIDCFAPDVGQTVWLSEQGIDAAKSSRGDYSIYALYAMGSTSSVCQGSKSDLDIWVCVSAEIPRKSLELLTEKCHFICAWAKALGCELNLFVTPEDRFSQSAYGELDTEDCGSAQSLFLLDEFYRSCIKLCGRSLLWFMVPTPEEAEDYRGYIAYLRQQGFVDDECWFDYGPVMKNSPREYFGSGLWFLYKGIDHPFKAALKIMLMEVYASEFPHTRLLSSQLKDNVYRGNNTPLDVDAYYLMFKKVEHCLENRGDFERLHLMRQCFYLKVHAALEAGNGQAFDAQRRLLLSELRKEWNWSHAEVRELENSAARRTESAADMAEVVLSSLIKSYRALLGFSISHGIESAITSDDAGVLSRKLYAAFDRVPGKIAVLSPEVRRLPGERDLTFLNPGKESLCQPGWYVYPAPGDSLELLSAAPVYIGTELCQSVAFAALNGHLGPRTRVSIKSARKIPPAKVQRLSSDLKNYFAHSGKPPSVTNLQNPRSPEIGVIVLNFAHDPTREKPEDPHALETGTALSCSRQKLCLIGSVETVSRDTWGMLSYRNFGTGEEAVLALLSSYLRVTAEALARGVKGNLLSELKIFAYCEHHEDLVRCDILRLFASLYACFDDPYKTCVFQLGHGTYEARRQGDGVFLSRRGVFRPHGALGALSHYNLRPEYALQVPPSVDRVAQIGVVQYFFTPTKDPHEWDIFIVNEANEVSTYKSYHGSRALLVNSINRFYARQSEDAKSSRGSHFNLPQYFVLSKDLRSLHPFTIKGSL